jgi:hypothetical protein
MIAKSGRSVLLSLLLVVLLLALASPGASPAEPQSSAMSSIRIEDMELPTRFLSSTMFRGRNVPSVELEIAAEYLALKAEDIGLEPVMANGSFFQEVPLEVSSVDASSSALTVSSGASSKRLSYPESFGVRGRFIAAGAAEGNLVLLGLGAHAPELGWDDFEGVDVQGKVVVFLDA